MTEKIEIDVSELESLKAAQAVLKSLYENPEKGLEFKKLLKSVDKNVKIPELDAVEATSKYIDEKYAAIEEQNKALKERLDGFEKTTKERDEVSKLQSELDGAKKKWGFTDEGMNKVIARMKEKSNPDVDAAAAWVASQEPKPNPVKSSSMFPESANIFGTTERDENWKDLHENPQKWEQREIERFLSEQSLNDAA